MKHQNLDAVRLNSICDAVRHKSSQPNAPGLPGEWLRSPLHRSAVRAAECPRLARGMVTLLATPQRRARRGMRPACPGDGYARHFYQPPELRTLAQISADILALEQETEGLLSEITKGATG